MTRQELETQVLELQAKIEELEAENASLKKGGSRKIMGQATEWLRERDIRGGKLSATQAMVVCVLKKASKPITPKGITVRLKNRIETPATGLDAKLRPCYQSLQLMGLISFARNGKPGLHYELTSAGSEIMEPIMADMTSEDPGSCFMKSDAVKSWFTNEDIEKGDEVPTTEEGAGDEQTQKEEAAA